MPLLRSVILSCAFCLPGIPLVAGDAALPTSPPRGLPVSKLDRPSTRSPLPLATVVSDTGLSSRLPSSEPSLEPQDGWDAGHRTDSPQHPESLSGNSAVESRHRRGERGSRRAASGADGSGLPNGTAEIGPRRRASGHNGRRFVTTRLGGSLALPEKHGTGFPIDSEPFPLVDSRSPAETASHVEWPEENAALTPDDSAMPTVYEVGDFGTLGDRCDMAAPWPVEGQAGDFSFPDHPSVRQESAHPSSDRRSSHRAARRSARADRRAARDASGESCDRCSPWARLFPFAFIPPSGGIGIGHERVMFAPFFTDSAQPFSHVSLRYESGWDLERPDRAEFFWAAPPTGPGPERSVDVTTLTARIETATDRASAIFEVPLRAVSPVLNSNASGIGDLTVGGKLVLVSGRDWVITQQTLTYLNTGPAARGLGTGHASIEPGLLARYRWTDETYFHGQLRYHIPFSGTGDYFGEVLIWGVGVSSIWYETDAFAILPTFEVVRVSFLDGQRTTAGGLTADVDGETAIDLLPGVRFVLGPQGDLGLTEVGISGGASVGNTGWYSARLQIEARWSF